MPPLPIARTRPKRLPLWPLYLLPFLGLGAGLIHAKWVSTRIATQPVPLVFIVDAAYGLGAGIALMMSIAIVVLAYRVARQRFTISSMLVTVAIFSLFLGLIRSMF